MTLPGLNKYTFYIVFMSQFDQTRPLSPSMGFDSPIIELRQYTLHHGKRDVLIDIFEREFMDAQENVGINILGQFRDLDNADRFVWLRGFPDMSSRPQRLNAFYTSAVWRTRAREVNEMLADYSNVLLLRYAWADSEFPPTSRAQTGEERTSLVAASICPLSPNTNTEFIQFFIRTLKPLLRATGARCLAAYITDSTTNNYPRLPIRESENVFVWFTTFDNQVSYHQHIETLHRHPNWPRINEELQTRLVKPLQMLKLAPTTRSKVG